MPRGGMMSLAPVVAELWLADDSTSGTFLNSSGGELGRTFTSAREHGVGQMIVGHGPHTARSKEIIVAHLTEIIHQFADALALPGERFAVRIVPVGDDSQMRALVVTITRLMGAQNDSQPAA